MVSYSPMTFSMMINDRIVDEESDRASATPPSRLTPPSEQIPASPSSSNETQTEHESENE